MNLQSIDDLRLAQKESGKSIKALPELKRELVHRMKSSRMTQESINKKRFKT